ncbi:unnamed protein product [Darwinula stevensoni]|uniref:Uncharacterized protein n=1 Tax=Darwinula stevensoni TaxID=69355 RepID=A0A7R9A5L9_9CRUS|nr:unnamed protein product [Darwinula stevensoni]CAG0894676.1 unnamed protein product [Darwinula stevensoni]
MAFKLKVQKYCISDLEISTIALLSPDPIASQSKGTKKEEGWRDEFAAHHWTVASSPRSRDQSSGRSMITESTIQKMHHLSQTMENVPMAVCSSFQEENPDPIMEDLPMLQKHLGSIMKGEFMGLGMTQILSLHKQLDVMKDVKNMEQICSLAQSSRPKELESYGEDALQVLLEHANAIEGDEDMDDVNDRSEDVNGLLTLGPYAGQRLEFEQANSLELQRLNAHAEDLIASDRPSVMEKKTLAQARLSPRERFSDRLVARPRRQRRGAKSGYLVKRKGHRTPPCRTPVRHGKGEEMSSPYDWLFSVRKS